MKEYLHFTRFKDIYLYTAGTNCHPMYWPNIKLGQMEALNNRVINDFLFFINTQEKLANSMASINC